MTHEYSTLIDGETIGVDGEHENRRRVVDPARDETITHIADTEPHLVDAALAAARQSFDHRVWRDRDPMERGDALQEIARRLREVADELAHIESRNVGKPITQATGEMAFAAALFDYYGRIVVDHPGDVIDNGPEQITVVLREPVGVVVSIIPWNYPLAIAALSIAPALAAGCSVVLKPSELTPLTALRLAELTQGALPPGVLNVITGDGRTGQQLVHDHRVDQIRFTGGTTTGTQIAEAAGRRATRLSLELGGKSPTVLLSDAPLDLAINAALQRIAANQGENCGAGSRLLVHTSLYDEVLDRICLAADKLVIGDPQAHDTDLGPMITREHRDKVLGYTEEAASQGTERYRGPLPDQPPLKHGFYVPFTVFEAGPGTRLWQEEVFGPVLAVTPFDDDNEAIRLANDTDYGLMAAVWSADRGRALSVARRIDAGVIRVNEAIEPLQGPWGGYKRSGNGRTQGRWGLDDVTEIKQISIPLS
jgi:acyl-CoA reductase-like NAD-dependent aldehyde dehydrogenase